MSQMIPYSKQDISVDDVNAVIKVLKSNLITQGPEVQIFEKKCSDFLSAKHSLAVNSATSALILACKVLDVGEGDIVWTSPNSFVASANCAMLCGASIDFIDIDEKNFNISISSLELKLKQAKLQHKLPKAIIPVHFAGQPCDLKAINKLSKKYNFRVIEDASHAFGAKYLTSQIGDCKFSDACIFSFHPVKIFTTGEGGLICVKNDHLHSKLKLLISHGVTKDPSEFLFKNRPLFHYEQHALGFNFRMTSFQAALGISQLKKVPYWHARRNKLAARYNAAFSKSSGIECQTLLSGVDSSYHLFVILTNCQQALYEHLGESDILTQVHYPPIHLQPFYQSLGFKIGDFPLSEQYYEHALSIPLYPKLTFKEQDFIIKKILTFVQCQ